MVCRKAGVNPEDFHGMLQGWADPEGFHGMLQDRGGSRGFPWYMYPCLTGVDSEGFHGMLESSP